MEPVLLVVSPDPVAGAQIGVELDRYRRDYHVEIFAGDDVGRPLGPVKGGRW